MSRDRTGPLRLPSLNHDILSHIASFLSYPDTLSLLCTCKAISTISTDAALHTVVLGRSSIQLLQFRDFLLARTPRALFVRSLTVTKTVTWDLDGMGVAQALADILEKTTQLEVFSCAAIRELVAEDGRVNENLIALTRLRELTLLEGGAEVVDIATTTKSLGIERLTLDIAFFGATRIAFEDFIGKLARYTRLTELSISRMYRAQIALPHPSQYQSTGICIPSVRTLTLACTYLPLALATAVFPNVAHLDFSNARHYPNFGNDRPQPHDVAACWPALEDAHIDARDLAVWPISGAVRRLDLEVLRSGYSAEALAALSHMDLRVLACAYTISVDNRFWEHLPTIARELRFLDVRLLELSASPRRYMLTHLKGFPRLTALFICIRAFNYPADPHAETATLARQLARDNPKLRFVGLSFANGRSMREDEPVFEEERLGSSWFEIQRGDTLALDGLEFEVNLKVREIPAEVGLRLRDYMYEVDYATADWEEHLATFT